MAEFRRLRIEGFRSIEKLELPLSGLSVLIGANGAGKSTILEALELLRRAATPSPFLDDFQSIHGATHNTLRRNAPRLRLEVELTDGLVYEFSIVELNGYPAIAEERLRGPGGLVYERVGGHTTLPGVESGQFASLGSNQLLLPHLALGTTEPARAVAAALAGIEVHVPFETTAAWAMRAAGKAPQMRMPAAIRSTKRLERFGVNLANAYLAMLTDDGPAEFAKTMEYVRLGLGDHVQDVRPRMIQDGFVALRFRLRGIDRDVNDAEFSGGQLAYLAFVALFRLGRREMGNPGRSLLAFDEPETDLHPALLRRVVDFFEHEATQHPVILATQSDGLLDSLDSPQESVRVCELEDDTLATVVRRLDGDALKQWLEDFSGLGGLRANGYLPQVVDRRT